MVGRRQEQVNAPGEEQDNLVSEARPSAMAASTLSIV